MTTDVGADVPKSKTAQFWGNKIILCANYQFIYFFTVLRVRFVLHLRRCIIIASGLRHFFLLFVSPHTSLRLVLNQLVVRGSPVLLLSFGGSLRLEYICSQFNTFWHQFHFVLLPFWWVHFLKNLNK
jgi:hypothetical protein